MKKHLILSVVMLVVGIRVGRLFPQSEYGKAHAEISPPQITTPAVVEPQSKEEEIPQSIAEPPFPESPIPPTRVAPDQGERLSDLLCPERRRNTEENPYSEDGIRGLYDELQSETFGSNGSAIERHAELRQALEKYIESRTKAKSETTDAIRGDASPR